MASSVLVANVLVDRISTSRAAPLVTLLVALSLALWRTHRTRPPNGTPILHAVRVVAVALNVVAALLQLNVEVMSRLHHTPNTPSFWIRIEEFAPFFALVVLLWSPRNSATSSARA